MLRLLDGRGPARFVVRVRRPDVHGTLVWNIGTPGNGRVRVLACSRVAPPACGSARLAFAARKRFCPPALPGSVERLARWAASRKAGRLVAVDDVVEELAAPLANGAVQDVLCGFAHCPLLLGTV